MSRIGKKPVPVPAGVTATVTGALELVRPMLQTPVWSWTALFDLVVPLAITVLVVQNGQGFAVLRSAGHQPPIDAITVACGAGALRVTARNSCARAVGAPG